MGKLCTTERELLTVHVIMELGEGVGGADDGSHRKVQPLNSK